MLDVHIDDFFKDCAVILLQGFKFFPAKQVLYVEDISGPDEVDEFGLHSPRHMSALGAIIWLQEEGYIRFGEMNRQDSVDDFVLGAKAFSKLLAAPADDPTSTLANQLEYARLQNDSTLIRQLMQAHFLSQS